MFEVQVNSGTVDSIAVHGRAWYITFTNGKREEYGDPNDILTALTKELGDPKKARKFLNQLQGKSWLHGLQERDKERGYNRLGNSHEIYRRQSMNSIKLAKQILVLAKELMSMEFSTEEEKKKYEQEHDVRPGTKLKVTPREHKEINGISPQEYATQWGDTKTPGGRAMYNYSSEKQKKDPAFYKDMIGEIESLKNDDIDQKDKDNLHKLHEHVLYESGGDQKPAGRDTRYLQKIKDSKEPVFDVAEMLSDVGGIKPRMVDDKLGRGSQKVTYDYQKRSPNLRPMSLTVEVSPKPNNDGLTVSFFNHETNKPYGTNKRVKTVEFKGDHTLENSARKIQDMVNGFIG